MKRNKELIAFQFCIECKEIFTSSWCSHDKDSHKTDKSTGEVPLLDGVTVIKNFISKDEELYIMKEIEKFPWRASQSGRRKQVEKKV